MFCKNCGSQLPDGVAFCTACGTPVSVAPQPPVAPQAPVMPQPPVAPQAPVMPQPPVAPQAPVMPDAYVAPQAPVTPDAYAAPVMAQPPVMNPMYAPVAPAPEQKKKGGAFKIIAIIAAAAILLGVLVGVLCFPTAKGVTEKYLLASELNGDTRGKHNAMAGDALRYYEDVVKEDPTDLFDGMEDFCADEGIYVSINSFEEYYDARLRLYEVWNQEEFGADYEAGGEVITEIEMDDEVIQAYRDLLRDPTCSDYIDADKIKKGKFMVVRIEVDAENYEDDYEEIVVVPLVKYGLKWKVLDPLFYVVDDDYDVTEVKTDAYATYYNALDAVEDDWVD